MSYMRDAKMPLYPYNRLGKQAAGVNLQRTCPVWRTIVYICSLCKDMLDIKQ